MGIMTVAMERILAWKLLPRLMMLVMTLMYIRVIEWFMSLPPEAMTSQATCNWSINRSLCCLVREREVV